MAINPITGLEDEIDPLTGLPVQQSVLPPDYNQLAQAEANDQAVIEPPRVDVMDYIRNKYGDEARAKVAADSQVGLGDKFSSALAAIGAGFQGKDSASAGNARMSQLQGQKRQALDDFDKGKAAKMQEFAFGRDVTKAGQEDVKFGQDQEKLKREQDPNSQESKIAQDLAVSMGMSPEQAKGLSAAKFKDFSPSMSKKYEIEQRQLDRREAREARQYERDVKRDEKQVVKDDKKKTSLNEIEDRRRNIEDNLNLLEAQIKDKGTYEAFGSHNEDLDRRMDMIATDMAKLSDPNSVARPSEVEMFKKGLIKGGMTGMRNSTALDLLKNFRSEVTKRADNAYKIRGIDNPGSQSQREETKMIGNKTYRKVPGGWEEVE